MSRRKAIVLLGLACALLVSAGAMWTGRGWLVERWCRLLLRHGDTTAQVGAVEDLGRWSRVEAVPAILDAVSKLKTLHPVRVAAEGAFPAMGPGAGAKLTEALKAEDAAFRAWVAKCLLTIHAPGERPLPLLHWMLAEGEEERKVEALAELGNASSLSAATVKEIARVFATHGAFDEATRAAEGALARLGPAATGAGPAFVEHVLTVKNIGAENALVRFGAPAVPALVLALHDDRDDRGQRAMALLARIGPAAAPAVPVLLKRLHHPSLRGSVLVVLGGIGPGALDALPALTADLRRAPVEDVWGILSTLADLGPIAIPAMREALASDHHVVRADAANAIAAMGSAAWSAVPALRQALADEEAEVRLAAAVALLKVEGPSARIARALGADVLVAKDRWLWDETLLAANPGLEGCDAQLAKFLAGDEEDRRWTLSLLAQVVKPAPALEETVGVLARQLDEEPLDLPAAEALWRVAGPPDLAGKLVRLLETSAFPMARGAAFDLLRKLGPEAAAAVPELVRLLAEGKVTGMADEDDDEEADETDETGDDSDADPEAVEEKENRLPEVIDFLAAIGPASRPALPILGELLKRGRPGLRVAAAHAIWRIGGEASSVIPELVRILGDQESWWAAGPVSFSTREFTAAHGECAARILGSFGPAAREALPVLSAALAAESPRVRHGAAWAIWKVAGEVATVIPILVRTLEGDDDPSWGSSDGWFGEPVLPELLLAEIGQPAVPELLRLLGHRLHPTRVAAARTLGGMAAPSAEVLRALAGALRDPHHLVAEAALGSLARARLGPADLESLRPALWSGDPLEAERAARVLSQQGPAGLPLLLERLEAGGEEPHEAFYQAFRPLRFAVPELTSRARKGAPVIACRALRALCEIDERSAPGDTGELECLLGCADSATRLEAARLVAMTRGDAERVFSAVMEGCRSAERELRARAARALCALTPAGSSSVAGLVDLVRNGEAEVAAAAAACLAGSSELDEASIDALTARCADPDAGLRRACARALGAGGRGAVRAIPPLLARLDDPDRQVRRAAARALGRLEQPDAKTVEALAAVLGDGDLAGVAVRALERWGKTALPAVPGLIQALQNQEVRVDAARTLGRVASESRPAREALLAALESTRDREFCRQLLAISPEIGPAAGAWITGQMASPEGWCFWGSPNHIVAAVGDSMQGAVSALLAILAKDDRFARSQAIQVLGAMGPAAREAVPRLRALSEDREVDLEVQVAARRALRRIGL